MTYACVLADTVDRDELRAMRGGKGDSVGGGIGASMQQPMARWWQRVIYISGNHQAQQSSFQRPYAHWKWC